VEFFCLFYCEKVTQSHFEISSSLALVSLCCEQTLCALFFPLLLLIRKTSFVALVSSCADIALDSHD